MHEYNLTEQDVRDYTKIIKRFSTIELRNEYKLKRRKIKRLYRQLKAVERRMHSKLEFKESNFKYATTGCSTTPIDDYLKEKEEIEREIKLYKKLVYNLQSVLYVEEMNEGVKELNSNGLLKHKV